MIRLNATTRKLQAVLAGAITTNQLPVSVSYSDKTTASYTGAMQLTNTNSTTPVDICAAPAASTVRDIDFIGIRNRDTVAATVTVLYDDNGTDYEIITAALDVGDVLTFVHGAGWQVVTDTGELKTSGSSGGTGDVVGPAASTDNAVALFDGNTGKLLQNSVVIMDPATGDTTGMATITLPNTGLHLLDTNASHDLIIAPGSDLSADRTLTLTTGDAARTITLTGNPTLADWFDQSVKVAATPTFGATTITGLLNISGAAAGQIQFPGTQNPSANVNTLDDYEEGTWTPGISFGGGVVGITYSTQVAAYTKIGNHVSLGASIILSNKGSSTGGASLTGFPFPTQNTSLLFVTGTAQFSFAGAIGGAPYLIVVPNATVASINFFNTATGGGTATTDVNFSNTSQVLGASFSYFV